MSLEKVVPIPKSEHDAKPSFDKSGTTSNTNHHPTNPKDQDYKRTKFSPSRQGYDYQGEKPEIGVILTLKNERFSNKVVFSTFVDKMKNYVLTHFNNGKDMVPILEALKDPESDVKADEPKDLTDDEKKSDVKKWMKQEEVKLHIKRINSLETNKEKLYALIWGQSSHALQEVVKGDDNFDIKEEFFDCIWLLEKVKLVSSGVDSKINKHYTLLQALTSFCTIKQGTSESNDSYRKRVDATSLTLSLVGGSHFLCSPELIETADPRNPTETEILGEIEKLKAMVCVLRADESRYTKLQDSLMDGVYKGRDEFPVTVTAAYDLLQHNSGDTPNDTNKRLGRFRFRRRNNFTLTQTTKLGCTPGRDGKVYSHVKCHNCEEPGHYANQCPKSKTVTFAHFSLTQKKLELINKNWVLLDTCSTVSVFCNPVLVKNIISCAPGDGITVLTNGGSETFNQVATSTLLPLQVHFNSSSIANILSLSDIANLEGARLTMDTHIDRAINLHYQEKLIQFRECVDGLYYWDSTTSEHNKSKNTVTPYSSFVQTVASNQSFYSKRDIQGANKARLLQEQLAWPSDSAFERIINHNLINNSTVTIHDIKRAQYLYGTATSLLKGKMVRNTPHPVTVQTTPTPTPVLTHHPLLQLYVDFFYVNQLPFLHTKCSQIGFLTAHGGTGRSMGAIKKILDSVINLYESRGFKITELHGDNEFDVPALKDFLLPITIHIYGREEHVPNIERSNRTIKEKCRSICHSLPFRKFTKLMTTMLVEYALYWLNAIPPPTGISKHVSPATIIQGKTKPDFKYRHLPFGTYCMIYISTKNNMKARSVPGIALAPSNEWGGHYFMSLLSGKRVHGYTWTEVPIGADVIERVHELASIEKQPEFVDGTVSFEWGNMTNTITNAHLDTSDDKANTDRDRNDARNEVDTINYIEENNNDTEYDDNIEKEMNIAMLEENDNDDSVLMNNDEDYDKDEDFFDNDDDEINEKIDEYTEHLHNQHEDDSLSVLQNLNTSIPDHTHERSNDEITNNSLYHTLEPEPEKTVNTVMNTSLDEPTNVDNNPSSYTGRPRREGAGTGVMSFEPSMGGKEHLIYKKKCMLHTKRMERNT